MKESEEARGEALAGVAVKINSELFLIGLSAAEADMARNRELLENKPWFDVPIMYNNGQRAILAVEKGTAGDGVFNRLMAEWTK